MKETPHFDPAEVNGILQFLKVAEQLKNTLRSAHSSQGRHESVAEHTWRLCLLGTVLQPYYPELDHQKLMKILLIHDMGEIIHGDIPAIHQNPEEDKQHQEREDFQKVIEHLPAKMKQEYLNLWDDYHQVSSPEAQLAKALDKLETLLQHVQGDNPKQFDYGFNLGYGTQYTRLDPLVAHIRDHLDELTRKRMAE